MKKNLILVLVFFIFVATGFPEVIQITSGNYNRQNVSGDGHCIVFEDDSTEDIGWYDVLGDSIFFPIRRDGVETNPCVWGENIACQTDAPINVLFGSISGGVYNQLTSSLHPQGDCTGAGSNLGWTDARWGISWGGHPVIFNGTEEFILTEGNQSSFVLSESFGAWIDEIDNNIWGIDLGSGDIFRITFDGGEFRDLNLTGDTLVFSLDFNIHIVNLHHPESAQQITDNFQDETLPHYRNGYATFLRGDLIVLLEIETGLETIVRGNDNSKNSVVMLDSGIFWSESIDGHSQIFFSPFIFLDVEEEIEKPKEFEFSAYPNPFNSVCQIDAPVGSKIDIFDTKGHQIASLASNEWQPNESVNSGIYFVHCAFDGRTKSFKVVYCK